MRTLLAGALVVLVACGGAELGGRVDTLHQVVKKARDNGAYKCAPEELAMAESHLAFAELELDEGDYYRAKSELAIADRNANEAIRKSPKDKCAPEVAIVEPDKKEVKITVLDTDGDGLNDDVDECPKDPEDKDGFKDTDGCPDPDNDNDGILDDKDQCPIVAEDMDKFQDEDGCPEDDNDQDGLADRIDQCPNEAEDKDGFEDDDGCPDNDNDKDGVPDYPEKKDACPDEYAQTPDGCPQKYQLIVVTKEKIELKQTIYFEFRKAVIKPVSFPLLDEVALAMHDNPNIKVRIEGHTDSVGPDDFNMKLSQKRADAVRAYLIKKGVDPSRMEAKGYGETVPIADNRTQEGRDQNRRVEFVITSQGEQ
jgi:outer membrane protein OmpA-like peptidoglycan-associated protein